MSFLQPWLLAALPLAALPVLIHLINQRRYSTVEWGAMQFLLSANRMSRGFARVRQWLILLMRTLAIAGLIVAICRPLASGWLGLTASTRADTTLIVLDRSPSMQEGPSGLSKLDAARQQLVETLETLGSNRWVLIDSATGVPQEIDAPSALLDTLDAGGASVEASLPDLMQTVHDYIKTNQPGRTEVWIASDLRENDWRAEDGRWGSLKNALIESPQEVRFHLLTYTEPMVVGRENLAIRVTEVRREETRGVAELVLSLLVTRQGGGGAEGVPTDRTTPVRIEIDGSASTLDLELTGTRFELKNHRIALPQGAERGWGKVSLPADANPADNEAYLAYEPPPVRRTAIVTEEADRMRALRLAARIAPRTGLQSDAESIAPSAVPTLAWEELALVVWQAPLPEGRPAEQLQDFIDLGGRVLFLPPRRPTGASFAGVRWGSWEEPNQLLVPSNWRSDQDLLAKVGSGASLPVGRLKVQRCCSLSGELNALANLPDGRPLLARAITDRGAVYFAATTPDPNDSTLAADGVVLYVAIQRMIESGMAKLGDTRTQPAGAPLGGDADDWRPVASSKSAGDAEALSTDYHLHAGVYQQEERLVAVNRPVTEDQTATLSDERVDRLMEGLAYDRMEGAADRDNQLVREIWRLFLGAMMVALTAEAALCLPRPPATRQAIAIPRSAAAQRAPQREAVA